MYHYRLYGLSLISDLEVPQLVEETSDMSVAPEIRIEECEVPESILNITDKNGNKCILSKTGLLFNGKLYKYDDLAIDFYTTNYLRKVCLNIEFAFVNTDDEVAPSWNVRLNNDLVNAIVKYDIDLYGKDIFNYIINNKIIISNTNLLFAYLSILIPYFCIFIQHNFNDIFNFT